MIEYQFNVIFSFDLKEMTEVDEGYLMDVLIKGLAQSQTGLSQKYKKLEVKKISGKVVKEC